MPSHKGMPFLLFDSSRCQGKGKPCPHCLALVGTRGYPPHASRKGGEVFHNLKAIRDGGNLFLYWTIRSPPPHASQGMRLLSPPPCFGQEQRGRRGSPPPCEAWRTHEDPKGVCSPLVRSMDALWGRINKISN